MNGPYMMGTNKHILVTPVMMQQRSMYRVSHRFRSCPSCTSPNDILPTDPLDTGYSTNSIPYPMHRYLTPKGTYCVCKTNTSKDGAGIPYATPCPLVSRPLGMVTWHCCHLEIWLGLVQTRIILWRDSMYCVHVNSIINSIKRRVWTTGSQAVQIKLFGKRLLSSP